jgi:SAM-dependent methyltransferase
MSSQTESREVAPQRLPAVACWCGNQALEDFSNEYRKCAACGTLVVARMPDGDHSRVTDDASDFYGAHYHLTERYGYPSVVERARTDLPERCLHWLRTVLRHRRPPARALDVGCGHGGFVALLRWAGFDASGLELSQAIVEYARRVFAVPILHGPLAEQSIAPGSLDIIALMDVVEHFPDPVAALRDCVPLLADDGLLLLQTPCFPEGQSHDEMVATRAPFLQMLKEQEHLYLFSQRAITELLTRLGLAHIHFEPAIFAHYDMSLVASRRPLASGRNPVLDLDDTLPPEAHLVEALFSVDDQRQKLTQELCELRDRLAIAEEHAAQRLALIGKQGDQLGSIEGERNLARWQVEDLTQRLRAAEQSRDANSERAEVNAAKAAELVAEKTDLEARLLTLTTRCQEIDKLAAERLDVLHRRDATLAEQANEIRALSDRIAELESRASWTHRLLQRLAGGRSSARPTAQQAAPLEPPALAAAMSGLAADRNLFGLWEAYGFHVTPVHFYAPIPHLEHLSDRLWASDSELPGIDMREEAQLAFLTHIRDRYKSEYDAFPDRPTADPQQYYFEQPMFRSVDAEVLYCVIRERRPRRVVEVGSGYSTLVSAAALRANAASGHRGEFIAIEPYPNEDILGGLAELDELRRVPVESVELDLFTRLATDDVLFIDSSHVLRIDNDVRFLFLEVLPRLAPGVTVHIHDIFLPREYPRQWVVDEQRFWTEQYLLQAFLAFNAGYEVLWAGSYMHLRHSDELRRAFRSYHPDTVWPGSFWMRRVGAAGR